jgi:hypothetical protein
MLARLLSRTALALCAAFVMLISGGSDLEHVAVLGAALGGVLGLVPNVPSLGKLGGFALGFVVAWAAFGVRALLLPDTTAVLALAAFLVILLCGVVAALSTGRMPLWSALLGVAAVAGAYENAYTISPPQFLTTSPLAATTVLLAAGFGFVGVTLVGTFAKAADAPPAVAIGGPPSNDIEMLESILAGGSK